MKKHTLLALTTRPAIVLLLLTLNARLSLAPAQNTWNLDGNFVSPGQFLGSTNFEAVELKAGGMRVLRLEPDPRGALAGNIIGGFISNRVEQPGSGGNVIAGGGFFAGLNIIHSNTAGVFIGAGSANEIGPNINDAVIAGGFGNTVQSFNSFIGSGRFNAHLPGSDYSSIAGGYQNTNESYAGFIGGGIFNRIESNANYATIAGGPFNLIRSNTFNAAIGGGFFNAAAGYAATVPGGYLNSALGDYSFAAGQQSSALHPGTFVWADSQNTAFTSTTSNQFSVRAVGGVRFVTSGAGMTLDGIRLVASGAGLSLNDQPVLVSQPTVNDANHSNIVNVVNGSPANSVSNGVFGATIGGGGAANYNGSSAPNTVTADFGTVSGGKSNISSGAGATVAGGVNNLSSGPNAAIGGGANNSASGPSATVPGGNFNSASGSSSFAAGQHASAAHNGSFVWADSSSSSTFASTAANQFLIRAAGGVGIGTATPTKLLHLRGTAPAIALEDNASAANQAGYVSYRNNASVETAWVGFGTAGSPTFSIVNARSGGNIELFPFSGRVGVRRTPTANAFEVEGNASKSTAGSWLANSDARIKTGVRTVTGALDKLSQVRLVEFHYTDEYRAQHPTIKNRTYLNVVAQEFQKVFPEDVQSSGEKLPGGSDTILQVDTYPLTIYSAAAIQELNRKVEQKETEITELKQRLEKLEHLINQKTGGAK